MQNGEGGESMDSIVAVTHARNRTMEKWLKNYYEEAQVIVASKDTLQQRQSPDSAIHASHTGREVNTPVVLEKPSEDGYNWRKYGQKNVKGNEYVRSYYKCSYRNCLAQKRVERSLDGRITDITYLKKHDHPRPHSETQEAVPSSPSVQIKTPDSPLSVVKEKPSVAHTPTTEKVRSQPMDICERPIIDKDDTLVDSSHLVVNQARDIHLGKMTPKKRKRSIDGADIISEKSTNESRLVVHTVSEVDMVNDGYRWRKYGQKMVKGNPNPRSYYRCSTARCPVKKHVERAPYDPNVVITTYGGEHDHTITPIRAVVPGGLSLERDATQNGSSISEEAKNYAIVLSTAKEITTKEVVKTEPEILPGEQKMQPEAKNSDQNEQQVEDSPISTASKADNVDVQTLKQEKVAPIQEMKMKVVSTEQQRPDNSDSQTVKQEKPDTVQEMKIEEAQQVTISVTVERSKSNEERRTSAEPVNCST